MERHGDMVFLGNRYDTFHEILKILPQQFRIRYSHIPSLPKISHVIHALFLQSQIKGLYRGPIPSHRGVVIRPPYKGWGEMISQHGNTCPSQAADGFTDILNLPVPSFQSQHGFVIKGNRHVFHGLHNHAVPVARVLKTRHVLILPQTICRQVIGQIKLYPVYPHLSGIGKDFLIHTANLSICQSHIPSAPNPVQGSFLVPFICGYPHIFAFHWSMFADKVLVKALNPKPGRIRDYCESILHNGFHRPND